MEYKEVIQTTIKEVYPNYIIRMLLKKLEDRGVICYKTDLFNQDAFLFRNEDDTPYHPKYDSSELLIALDNKPDDVINCSRTRIRISI